MNEAGYFRDARLEDAERVRIGHHHTGDVVTQHSAKGVNVDGSLGRALHLDNLQTANGGRGGVSAVGRIGDNNLGALRVAARLVVTANDHQAREFAVGTSIGIERELTQACYFGQCLLHVVIEFERALCGGLVLCGMKTCEAREGCHLLVDFGIVLHRATAQGIEARINAEVIIGHIRIVTTNGEFVHLGQLGSLFAPEFLGNCGRRWPRIVGERITRASRLGNLKDEFVVTSLVHISIGTLAVGQCLDKAFYFLRGAHFCGADGH